MDGFEELLAYERRYRVIILVLWRPAMKQCPFNSTVGIKIVKTIQLKKVQRWKKGKFKFLIVTTV